METIFERVGAFELTLCNARHVKQVPGHKTDVSDARWLCQLMEAGLLRGSFERDCPTFCVRAGLVDEF